MAKRGDCEVGRARVRRYEVFLSKKNRHLGIGDKRHVKIDCKIDPSVCGDKVVETSWRIVPLINEDEYEKIGGSLEKWSRIHD